MYIPFYICNKINARCYLFSCFIKSDQLVHSTDHVGKRSRTIGNNISWLRIKCGGQNQESKLNKSAGILNLSPHKL